VAVNSDAGPLAEVAFSCANVGEPGFIAVYRVPPGTNLTSEADAEAAALAVGTYPPAIAHAR
jgi:hypothetical protein